MLSIELLQNHLAYITELTKQSGQIQERITAAQTVVAEAETVRNSLRTIRDKREELLASAYLGECAFSEVEALDAELAEGQARLDAASLRGEAAAAAIKRLEVDFGRLQGEIASLSQQTPALRYQAHLEHAEAALGQYHEAAQALADAQAVLQARCCAVDQFADVAADPRRLYTIGSSGVIPSFTVAAPSLPGASAFEWRFDLTRKTAQELDHTLTELGSGDAAAELVRQRAEEAIARHDRMMQTALAAIEGR